MPTFNYRGVNYSGSSVSGAIEASSSDDARLRLRKDRIRVTDLRERRAVPVFGFRGRVGLRDASAFTRQFASMNSSAIPLVASLDALTEQTGNRILREAIRKISGDVQSGVSLAEALSRHPRIFNRLYCAMVKAGEAAGILSSVLLRLAEYQEKAVAVRNRVIGAFAYPMLVAVVAAVAVVALMTFVVPTFASMLSELGAELPLSTRIVIGTSEFLKIWIVPSILVMAVAGIALMFLYRTNLRFRLSMDELNLRLPLFGDLQKKSAVSRFSRTFGALLAGGVPIAEALEITATTAGNSVLEQGFQRTLEAIRSGRSLAEPLKETGVFPPMVIQMVGVGERSGNLPEMLAKIADYYDNEVDTAITTLTSILEPALIVLMGIVVAGVLISMYLPMFEMVGSIG
ncbi:MAG: type II secretion system F family protein [Chitinispirillaceae bacterium]|nr:type II secretion system F family protein [Chitinispirillaceae bacterium]